MSPSKFLPSVYHIKGLSAAEGMVFLDVTSAQLWLEANGYPVRNFRIGVSEIHYIPSLADCQMGTTEESIAERNRGLDTLSTPLV